MDKKVLIVLVLGLFLVGGVWFVYEDNIQKTNKITDHGLTEEDIIEIEEHFRKLIENQPSIDDQIAELRRVEIKLYGKEVSDYDAIVDNYIRGKK